MMETVNNADRENLTIAVKWNAGLKENTYELHRTA